MSSSGARCPLHRSSAFITGNPTFTTAELAGLALQHFGRQGSIRPLPSERDQNARLSCDGQDYVLKIANAAEDTGQIDLQNATMLHLACVGQPGIPRVVPTLSGADCSNTVDFPAFIAE